MTSGALPHFCIYDVSPIPIDISNFCHFCLFFFPFRHLLNVILLSRSFHRIPSSSSFLLLQLFLELICNVIIIIVIFFFLYAFSAYFINICFLSFILINSIIVFLIFVDLFSCSLVIILICHMDNFYPFLSLKVLG